jgi:hypothetical protein
MNALSKINSSITNARIPLAKSIISKFDAMEGEAHIPLE